MVFLDVQADHGVRFYAIWQTAPNQILEGLKT
jgi:hypothetical protein